MGISDRDYARPEPPRRGTAGRVGRVQAISVTAWLIIINVAVFLVGNVILQRHQVPSRAGTWYADQATPEQKARAQRLPSIKPVDGSPGIFFHPIVDPKTVAVDAQGRPMPNPLTGGPVFQEIGQERFLMMPLLQAWGHFSTGKVIVELQVWRVLTFQFLHASGVHLLFNMLGLWFVGGLVEQYLGARRYLAFYLLSGIFGALAYLALNLIGFALLRQMPHLKGEVPALLFDDIYIPLIGASAGVFGVLMAAAYIAPSAIVQVFFIIPMKLRTAVYVFLGLASLNLLRGGPNAGGDAAHVGGAFAGAFFIRRTHLLREFFDVFGNSRKRGARRSVALPRAVTEIDRILDKVRAEGLQSLTDAERRSLRRASGAES